jgi:hypothetical protein
MKLRSSVYKVGDLILYTNPQRMISPTLGIIIEEHNDISTDHRFFTVLLHTGRKQMISDHCLSLPGVNPHLDRIG